MKTGPGIDWSNGGTVNRDMETGIHYGVINQNEVLQAWADSSEAQYTELECSNCGEIVEKDMAECPQCNQNFFSEFDNLEPSEFIYNQDGYLCQQSADDPDISIIKSPYYTLCAYCSPCAPGAGYIMSTRDEGIKAYCYGHDWFDDGKAPYPVYSVETGERVMP